MSANQALLEAQVRHAVYLQRRGAGMANDVIPMVERIIDQVVGRVASTPDQVARQRTLLLELRSILSAAYAEVGEATIQHALDLAEYEVDYQAGALGKYATASFAKPAIEQVLSLVENDPMDIEPGRQMTIRQALEQFGDAKARQITQTISDGIVQQQTNAEIAQALGELKPLHRRQVDALVRTVANGAADTAKRELYRENADILKGERWTSTLDGRTSAVCRARDGELYPVGHGPRTPAHWNCRSVRVPVVKDELQIPGFEGERPVNGADGPGTVSARTTYAGFLRSQPREFVDEVLGPERAKMFLSGKVKLSDMVNRYGEPLTLAELRAREGVA